ncbi:MAG: site-2 protease family protein [Deltaproteobacteria bacterium]|nr:site-2 protease family protein [Deltaproteobacteria bacterium]
MTGQILNFSILALPILLAVTVHEVAHGWMAFKLGDDTAKQAGRLTLNPIKHLDLVGTLAFFLTQMVGWAKPVPVNPNNLRHPRQDMIWVAAAGPLANFIMAVIFALLFRLLVASPSLIPFLRVPLARIAAAGVMINLGLAIFNILPIPLLDGSSILSGLLPENMRRGYEQINRYGFIILLLLIISGLVDRLISPIISFLAVALLGGG